MDKNRRKRNFDADTPASCNCSSNRSITPPLFRCGVKIAVAIALGLGTMVGWKRIVVTVGEKIGKTT
jgi:phosphate/sulfate permease